MPVAGRQLSPLEVARAAYRAGIPLNQIAVCVAICRGESNFYDRAYNFAHKDRSYGLWQINMKGLMGPVRRVQYRIKRNEDLYKPDVNARAMASISKKGKSWKPWGAYTNGSYEQHLHLGEKAVADLKRELAHKPIPPKPAPKPKPKPAPKKPAPKQKPWIWSSVGPGQRNNSVKVVQEALIKLGYRIPAGATGYWGPQTTSAYAAWQRRLGYRGRAADGRPGKLSLRALSLKAGFTIKR